jgi:DNA polymerase-3 subunit epsilon
MGVLHVIDFEGTRGSGVTEYGVVTLIGGEISATHTAECAGKFDEHLGTFIELRRSGIFVGHSASVEDRLLRHYSASPGVVSNHSNPSESAITWGPWIDTKVLHRAFFKNISDYSLGNLINSLGLTEELLILASKFCPAHKLGYHSAMFDALATCILLKNLISKLEKNGIAVSDQFLLEYSQRMD